MTAYINGLACISHHNTIDENYFFEDLPIDPLQNKLLATEPVYKDFIPAAMIRRMSHIVKMGVSAGITSLKKAGQEKADAIIVGTGIGCYDDTDKFLRSMLDNDEQLLTPTSFIQSTHNTVAGQLALLIKCHGYNFTYVHQNLSFEYALQDALMLLNEKEAETVLVGGIDEVNNSILELFDRAGYIKKTEATKGYKIGEGAAFFSISSIAQPSASAKINGVKCKQHIDNSDQLLKETNLFIESIGLNMSQISLVLSGNCGDEQMDKKLSEFNEKTKLPTGYFKRLCGEYFTSSAFAVWLAASIIKKQIIPPAIIDSNETISNIRNILIVNHYHDQQYSFMCVSIC
ncbi:MAG: beta-ketoacyl synthase chain length factor [Bacteroidota bacterium]